MEATEERVEFDFADLAYQIGGQVSREVLAKMDRSFESRLVTRVQDSVEGYIEHLLKTALPRMADEIAEVVEARVKIAVRDTHCAKCFCNLTPEQVEREYAIDLSAFSAIEYKIVLALLPPGYWRETPTILKEVWGDAPADGDSANPLRAHLSRMRPKLEKFGWGTETMIKMGYRLIPLASLPAYRRFRGRDTFEVPPGQLLPPDQMEMMERMFREGVSHIEIKQRFGLSANDYRRIISGKRWVRPAGYRPPSVVARAARLG